MMFAYTEVHGKRSVVSAVTKAVKRARQIFMSEHHIVLVASNTFHHDLSLLRVSFSCSELTVLRSLDVSIADEAKSRQQNRISQQTTPSPKRKDQEEKSNIREKFAVHEAEEKPNNLFSFTKNGSIVRD